MLTYRAEHGCPVDGGSQTENQSFGGKINLNNAESGPLSAPAAIFSELAIGITRGKVCAPRQFKSATVGVLGLAQIKSKEGFEKYDRSLGSLRMSVGSVQKGGLKLPLRHGSTDSGDLICSLASSQLLGPQVQQTDADTTYWIELTQYEIIHLSVRVQSRYLLHSRRLASRGRTVRCRVEILLLRAGFQLRACATRLHHWPIVKRDRCQTSGSAR